MVLKLVTMPQNLRCAQLYYIMLMIECNMLYLIVNRVQNPMSPEDQGAVAAHTGNAQSDEGKGS